MKLAVAVAGVLTLAAQPVHAADAAHVDEVFKAWNSQDKPGCAVGVEQAGQAPVLRGYGMAELEHRIPIRPDTVFEAGSVSKQFTAAAILLLAADGKLKLSDDVRKYVPELPDYGTTITLDHLLSHTSGLRDWGEVAALAGWPRATRIYNPDEVLQIASRQKALNYKPGEAYSYTNTGYNLAALIVQRASGQSLADFSRDRIFKPLGMARTQWRDNFRRIVPDRATAYSPAAGGYGELMPFENTYGHGALLTTVGDLLTWNRAIDEGRLGAGVSEKLQEQARLNDGRKIAYARGVSVQTRNGAAEVSHSGATAGYRAWLARYPQSGLSVAVLCNAANANAVELGQKVADLHLPAAPAETAAVQPLPPEEARLRPGVYVDERRGMVARLMVQDGALRLVGGPVLQPLAAGRYRVSADNEVVFNEAGLERHVDGDVIAFRRVDAHTPTEAELQAAAGAYASEEAAATLHLRVRDGRLVLVPADRPSGSLPLTPLYRDAFTAGGDLIRLVRGKDGKVEALRFTGQRVWDLRFRRVAGS